MASVEQFGAETSGTEVAGRFAKRIEGVLITGVSPNSLGESLATAIAAHSPSHLILASRTPAKLQAVAALIPHVNVSCVHVDFSSFPSVRAAASAITRLLHGRKIDVLFNNAGINVFSRQLNAEGIELQFATNHLGPFLFTNLLLPLLASGGRVVNTSSEAHRISPVRFSDLGQDPEKKEMLPPDEEPRRGMGEGILRGMGGYEPAVAYGQSKTANVLFAVGLNGRGVKSFAVMPGTIRTDIVRGLDEEGLQGLLRVEKWKDLDQGVATNLVAALDPALDGERGLYLDDCQLKRPSKWASDPEKAERLWRLSEELVGQKFDLGMKSRL
ncbi:Short-chain dehydrogenase-like protein [Lachnellula subtilissima]|uniref:Short-chain dehydrogenase-like protein n=1 Tax=Lachnellula subtilissima TaxID=602034 RepID=A0A8H8U5U2_9HELO|nr:Short-chain dehydrogenase-like protein [Lachnellula subtilissima]